MNIFVANLNYKVQDDALRSLFEEFGEVQSAKIIFDRQTGRSKGFGFVEMPVEEEALAAIEELDGADFEGKAIAVKKAKPRTENKKKFNRY